MNFEFPERSNKLNKQLRGAGTSRLAGGELKKAPTQSFGSNHERNLVLACHNCNSLKQNGFLEAGLFQQVLSQLASGAAA